MTLDEQEIERAALEADYITVSLVDAHAAGQRLRMGQVWDLLRDMEDEHRSGTGECEADPCMWCVEVRKILASWTKEGK